MTDFLPNDYEEPSAKNNYFKFKDGENRIRILSKPVMGYEDWKDNKPVRFQMAEKPETPIDEKKPVKHFWALIVWNYAEQEIQIMQITQASIRKRFMELYVDKDWGAPFDYDIKIIKSGEKFETKYSINPVPHKLVDPAILVKFHEKRCNLDALFLNDDPFSSKWKQWTECGVSLLKEIEELRTKIKSIKATFTEDQLQRFNAGLKDHHIDIEKDDFDKLKLALSGADKILRAA